MSEHIADFLSRYWIAYAFGLGLGVVLWGPWVWRNHRSRVRPRGQRRERGGERANT